MQDGRVRGVRTLGLDKEVLGRDTALGRSGMSCGTLTAASLLLPLATTAAFLLPDGLDVITECLGLLARAASPMSLPREASSPLPPSAHLALPPLAGELPPSTGLPANTGGDHLLWFEASLHIGCMRRSFSFCRGIPVSSLGNRVCSLKAYPGGMDPLLLVVSSQTRWRKDAMMVR